MVDTVLLYLYFVLILVACFWYAGGVKKKTWRSNVFCYWNKIQKYFVSQATREAQLLFISRTVPRNFAPFLFYLVFFCACENMGLRNQLLQL